MDINNYIKDMNEGERALFYLCKRYENSSFKIIPNAMYKRVDDGTNQIDLIGINKKGIFVLEMKDYKGWIYGDENHREWTQSIKYRYDKDNKKNKFRNPVKQNENHIKTIKHILSNKGYNFPIYNIVVFGIEAELKNVKSSTDVIKISDVLKTINKYPDIHISNHDLENIYKLLLDNNINSIDMKEKHLEYINKIKRDNSIEKNKEDINEGNKIRDYNQKLNSEGYRRKYYRHKREDKSENLLKVALVISIVIFIVSIFRYVNVKILNNSNDISSNYNSNKQVKEIVNKNENIVDEISKEEHNDSSNNDVNKEESDKLKEINIKNNNNNELDINKKNDIEKENVKNEYISIGTTKEEVINIMGKQGEVDKNRQNTWYYSSLAWISFDGEGKVNGWNNYSNVLTKGMEKSIANYKPIKIGSSKQEVIDALGSPLTLVAQNPNKWNYSSLAWISFDENEKVNAWYNHGNVLTKGMEKSITNFKPIKIGSNKQEVINALGSPFTIAAQNPNKWNYSSLAWISFDEDRKVNGWNNYGNVLSKGMEKSIANFEPIKIGSSKKEVIEALGSPINLVAQNPNKWNYSSLAWISFNENEKVNAWYNHGNVLTKGMEKSRANFEPIRIGLNKQEVINALGSPFTIAAQNPNKWNYSSLAWISFNEDGKVNGWNNYGNVLSKGMEKSIANFEPIKIGSSKKGVIEALGSPINLVAQNPNKWDYSSLAWISFDENEKVNAWYNHGNVLTKGLEKSIANFEPIKIGSNKQEVINALGSPFKIAAQNPYKWYYNSLAWISFDTTGRVNKWYDYGNILTPKFASND